MTFEGKNGVHMKYLFLRGTFSVSVGDGIK
jgi:hypothetical protein